MTSKTVLRKAMKGYFTSYMNANFPNSKNNSLVYLKYLEKIILKVIMIINMMNFSKMFLKI